MSNIVAIAKTGALTRRDPRRLDLFRRTAGKDLRGDELDHAIDLCEFYGANPFVKDIYFFVFNAKEDDKRRVEPVLSIQLYRKIAARTGNYRPDDAPARFSYSADAKGPHNPLGIVTCELSVFQFSHGDWHRVTERLKWDERAPIVESGSEGFEWVETGELWEDSGKPKKKKVPKGDVVPILDPRKPNWKTMPETMLAKCVEAAAIRKAWPNETAGSYVEGELDQAQIIDLTATEIAENFASEQRLKKIGASNAILVDWMDNAGIVQVPVGQLGDRAIEWAKKNADEPMTVKLWCDRNRHALQEYWGRDKSGALELKKALEPILQQAAE